MFRFENLVSVCFHVVVVMTRYLVLSSYLIVSLSRYLNVDKIEAKHIANLRYLLS